MSRRVSYWFRPARLPYGFAAYYPVTGEAWAISIAALVALAMVLTYADVNAHSVSDMLIEAAPGTFIIFVVFDIVSRRLGEYPSWWRRKRWWR